MIGTWIGRAAPNPAGCSIRIGAPSHSTVSPASKPRTARTYWRTNVHGSGFWPSVRRPVNPDPIATLTRPGASSDSVLTAAAVAIGWRSDGTATPGPISIVDVRRAHSARIIQTSGYNAGESYNHARR